MNVSFGENLVRLNGEDEEVKVLLPSGKSVTVQGAGQVMVELGDGGNLIADSQGNAYLQGPPIDSELTGKLD